MTQNFGWPCWEDMFLLFWFELGFVYYALKQNTASSKDHSVSMNYPSYTVQELQSWNVSKLSTEGHFELAVTRLFSLPPKWRWVQDLQKTVLIWVILFTKFKEKTLEVHLTAH